MLWEYPTGLCPVLLDIHARVDERKMTMEMALW